ncbi:MAG: succinate dehydrogenase [Clostridia bacterium]|nr:succinate dehydrogenase [Clostridia bacterium]
MRLLLRILAAPIVVILTLFVWVCSAILYCSAYLLGLAGSLVGLMALVMFISGSGKNAILLLILAYLISPIGLPMAAAWLLARMQDLRYAIMDEVRGLDEMGS